MTSANRLSRVNPRAPRESPLGLALNPQASAISRRGTNGVSANGVTANFMFFDRDFLGTPVNLLLSSQKYQGVTCSPVCQNSLLLQLPHQCRPHLSATKPPLALRPGSRQASFLFGGPLFRAPLIISLSCTYAASFGKVALVGVPCGALIGLFLKNSVLFICSGANSTCSVARCAVRARPRSRSPPRVPPLRIAGPFLQELYIMLFYIIVHYIVVLCDLYDVISIHSTVYCIVLYETSG